MKYHELQAAANKDRKRVGRGISAGQGKTAGRGTKGQGARTGKKLAAGFMGGQRALMQAIPKARGFKSMRVPAQVIYLDQLNAVKGATIDNFTLAEAGLVATPHHTVKVIARGEYTGKATVKKLVESSRQLQHHYASAQARKKPTFVSARPLKQPRRLKLRPRSNLLLLSKNSGYISEFFVVCRLLQQADQMYSIIRDEFTENLLKKGLNYL